MNALRAWLAVATWVRLLAVGSLVPAVAFGREGVAMWLAVWAVLWVPVTWLYVVEDRRRG